MENEIIGLGTWKFRHVDDGVFEIHRRHNFATSQRTTDANGVFWVFGIAEVRNGSMFFNTKSKNVELTGRYGLFLPQWSLTFGRVECAEQNIKCLMSKKKFDVPVTDKAIVFKPHPDLKFPSTTQDVAEYLGRCDVLDSIEYNPDSSGLALRSKQTLDKYYLQNFSMVDLAKKLKTNSTSFGRAFRKEYGMAPVQYRNHMRVVAGSLEMVKGRAVTDVFQEVGFGDLSRFNKQFKRVSGTSPKKFSSKKKSRKTPSF
jgi:AraC-like DNA-binding protein